MFLALSVCGMSLLGFLVLFFVVIPFAIGQIGGWAALGREYRLSGKFNGPSWWFQDVTLRRWCNYSGCVSVGANSDGIYLNTIFWVCHPPLFIPWSELSATRRDVNFLGIRIGMVEFVAQRVPHIGITLRESVLKRIAAARSPEQTESDAAGQLPMPNSPAGVAQ
jgi:hypothetical protein